MEFEAVVQDAFCGGVVQPLMELGEFGRFGFEAGMPAWSLLLGVGALEDVGLGRCCDLERGDLLLLLGCRTRGVEGSVEHSRVFVAAVEDEHLLAVKFKAGALGFADHPDQRGVTEGGFFTVGEGPAAA